MSVLLVFVFAGVVAAALAAIAFKVVNRDASSASHDLVGIVGQPGRVPVDRLERRGDPRRLDHDAPPFSDLGCSDIAAAFHTRAGAPPN